jgi:AcrR family transcriptional regulator
MHWEVIMPKGSAELTAARREEIMDACESLYRTMNFKEITLKEIGKVTSFTRTSIYNYFQSKEEIFLALFEKEYREWTADLERIASASVTSDPDQLASEIADTLSRRELMLRLLSANLYDLEDNSRMERLIEFKQTYLNSTAAMDRILAAGYPSLSDTDRRKTLLTLYEFLHGIYPYAHATSKQKEAMDAAGVTYEEYTLKEFAYEGIRRILRSIDR